MRLRSSPPTLLVAAALSAVYAIAASADTTDGWTVGPHRSSTERRFPSQDWAYAVAVQRDNKIVAAGRTVQGGWYFALARYNADGTLDPTFGRSGKAPVEFESGSPFAATALELQPGGKLVVAGHARTSTNVFAIARYTRTGRLDAAFGKAGKVVTPFTAHKLGAWANALAIQPDGKLVAAGLVNIGDSERVAIARYERTGRLDPSFERDGKVALKIGGISFARAVAVQRDGKIVVAGATYRGDRKEIVVLRLSAKGRLDSSFGSAGVVVTDIASWSEASAIAIQPDGRIIVGGTAKEDFAVLRYTANGRLDSSFGSGGKVVTTFGITKGRRCPDCEPHDSYDEAFSLAVERDGKIVLAGTTDITGRFGEKGCCLADFALARYNHDGSIDTSFGAGGKVVTTFDRNAYAQDLAIQRDGRIVAAGGGAGYFALSRYTSNGRLDPTFGHEGKVRMRFRSR